MTTPKSGEWWLSDSGVVAYIVGRTLDGSPVWMQQSRGRLVSDEMKSFLLCFHHEPRCDSFDWVEPTPVSRICEVNPGEGYRWLETGEVIMATDRAFTPLRKEVWSEPTSIGDAWSEELYVPIRRSTAGKIQPVESPDDWVEITDPDHVLRPHGIDMVATKQGDTWYPCREYAWMKVSELEHCKFRCRRKDLPATQPVAQRIPVRLWCSRSILGMHAHVGVFARRDFDSGSMEIKHDGYKFYVEATE